MVALVREMYVVGVNTRKVGLVAEELGVSSLSSSGHKEFLGYARFDSESTWTEFLGSLRDRRSSPSPTPTPASWRRSRGSCPAPWATPSEEARENARAFMSFPREHWQKIRTNNVQERANCEIKRRYRSVQSFPSEASMMRLVCAVLADEEGRWSCHRVFSPESAARAPAPAPAPLEGEGLETVRLAAHEVVGEVLDRHGAAE